MRRDTIRSRKMCKSRRGYIYCSRRENNSIVSYKMSSYIAHPAYRDRVIRSNVPRKLTEDEIEDIVSVTPRTPCPDERAARLYRDQITEIHRQNLRLIELDPSSIEELKYNIVSAHKESLLAQGTAIGFYASEAIGATLTQMVLNAFHSSGSNNSSASSLEETKDIMFARTIDRLTSLYAELHFKDRTMSVTRVLSEIRPQLVGIKINQLLISEQSYDIIDADDYEPLWWTMGYDIPSSQLVLRLKFDLKKLYMYKVTLRDIANAIMRDGSNSDTLYIAYSPMKEAVMDIFCPANGGIGSIINGSMTPVNGCGVALKMPEIRSFVPTVGSKRFSLPYLAEKTFLEDFIRKGLGCLRLKGVSGVLQVYPIVNQVASIIMTETRYDSDLPEELQEVAQDGRVWNVKLNDVIMKNSGIGSDNIQRLLEEGGCTLIGDDDTTNSMLFVTPDLSFTDSTGRVGIKSGDAYLIPIEADTEGEIYTEVDGFTMKRVREDSIRYVDEGEGEYHYAFNDINTLVYSKYQALRDAKGVTYIPVEIADIDGSRYEVMIGVTMRPMKPTEIVAALVARDKKLKRDNIITQRTRLVELSEYISASCEIDTNTVSESRDVMKELLALEFLDNRRTIVNNMHIVTNTLGIEAARRYTLNKLISLTLGKGSYINPENIALIAEFITNKGRCHGASFNGISRQAGGHLSLSTIERAGEVITSSALTGKKEDMRNVSAAITVGRRMATGTGAFFIAQPITENGVTRYAVDDETFTALKDDDETKELARLYSPYMTERDDDFVDEDRTQSEAILTETNSTMVPIDADAEQLSEIAGSKLVFGSRLPRRAPEPELIINRPMKTTALSRPDEALTRTSTRPIIPSALPGLAPIQFGRVQANLETKEADLDVLYGDL